MINIKDVIIIEDDWAKQTFLVVDRLPKFTYEKRCNGNVLMAEDSDFFSFYEYDKPSGRFYAFGGRKFKIPIKNGESIRAYGQWWDYYPEEYSELTYDVGINTIDRLNDCYVFNSALVDKELVDSWLEENEPSHDYYKYEN